MTVLLVLGVIAIQAGSAQAQWTTPTPPNTNISNTNTGNVGVGTDTTTPNERLTVMIQDATNNGVTQVLSVAHTTTGTPAAGLGAGIFFRAKRSDGSIGGIGHIAGIWEDPTIGTEDGALVFAPVLNSSGYGTERMRITSSGNVGIGTTAPAYKFDVQGNAQWVARFKKTDATHGGVIIDAATGWNPNLAMAVNGTIKWYMNSNTGSGDALQFWESSGSYPRFSLTQAGNVGIGTASPVGRIDVRQIANSGALATLLTSYGANEDTYLRGGGSSAVVRIGDVAATTSKLLLMENGGNVGIGLTNPTEKLDVSGNLKVSGAITGGTIHAKYQDVAEWVESSQALAAGTVVVLDHTRSNQVVASSKAYDTRVAGVISLQPGIALGESGAGKVLVATTGRVKIKVDASAGPIQIGDLLVTSDKEGVAKKSEPLMLGGVQIHRPGTLIGKALEPLTKGTGEILVLLSLQ